MLYIFDETLLRARDLNSASQPRLFSTFEYRFYVKILSILILINFNCICMSFMQLYKPLGEMRNKLSCFLTLNKNFFHTSFQNKELKFSETK